MDVTDAKVVEKKIYEDDKKHEYASKGVAGTALGLGIAGTALGVLPWLTGNRNGGIFGSLGGNMPENVNINAYGAMGGNSNSPTALQVMEKECADELALTNEMFGLKLNTADKFYSMRETDVNEKFSLWKGYVDGINAENRRSMQAEFDLYKSQTEGDGRLKDAMVEQGFSLYKNQRDAYDALNEKYAAKFAELDKKVAVMEAVRPYQDKLLMCDINNHYERSINYTDRKTCRALYGVVGLPSTPTVTVLEGANPFGCNCQRAASTTTTGA